MEINMEYTFYVDNWGGQFSVPCSVVTEYLKTSDGNYIKVLLYILAAPSRNTTSDIIALATGLSVDIVDDAIIHWTSLGVLKLDGKLPELSVSSETKDKKLISTVESVKPADLKADKRIVVNYSQKELLEKGKTDKNLQNLYDEIQKFLNKTLNGTELSKLVETYELYEYDVPTILIAAEYCKLIGKCSVNYLTTVLKNWYERDICSYQEVESEINRLTDNYQYENVVRRCFEMDNRLTKKQREFADKWKELGITEELLEIAKEKCLDGTGGKISFSYINAVINSWHKKGIKTPDDVKSDDDKHMSKKATKFVGSDKENSYSVERVENMIKNFASKN